MLHFWLNALNSVGWWVGCDEGDGTRRVYQRMLWIMENFLFIPYKKYNWICSDILDLYL